MLDSNVGEKTNLIEFPGGIGSQADKGNDIAESFDLGPEDEGFDSEKEPHESDEAEGDDEHDQKFDGNLAEHLSDAALSLMGLDLGNFVEEDKNSRDRWINQYRKSLKYLGIEEVTRSSPWANACAVVHPGMLQGIVRFQSRALGKLFPTQGPCSISVKGVTTTPALQLLINKTQELFNHHLTRVMVESQTETDRLLFGLAQIGFAAKKIFYDDDQLGRVTSSFVEAEDLILPYGTDNIQTAQRFTHEMRILRNEFENLVKDGKYLDLPEAHSESSTEDIDELEEAKDRMVGQEQEVATVSDAVRVYEVYIDLYIKEDSHKLPGKKRSPYIVTIDKTTNAVYCIRRNWKEDVEPRRKRNCFSLYRYVPSDGSYGLGLVHLTGQLVVAATRILRQLVDAGELSNIPGILKSKSARMKSQGPVAPGELRDVELSPDELQKAFFPVPFKEPSQALIKLLEMIIAEIKAFSSTADLDISASSQNAPVGTTLALIERQTEISNAVQKRMHTSFSQELEIIKQYLAEYEDKAYAAIFGELEQALQGQGIVVVEASGDPGSSTMAQRVMQLQAVIQASVQAPQVYDLAVLHRTMITAMGLPDAGSLVPDKSQVPEAGIVEEHQALLNMKPIKAYADQDQKSHIGAHMAFLNDPMNQQLLEKNPQAQQMMAALMAHIAEHMAFEYANEIQKQMGTSLPAPGQGPQDPETAQALSQLVSEAAARVAQTHAAEAQQQAAQAQAADPAYQLEQRSQQLKETTEANKHALGQAKLEFDQYKADMDFKLRQFQIVVDGIKHAGTLDQQESQQAQNLETTSQALAHNIGSTLLQHAQHLDKQDDNEANRQHQADQQDSQQAHQADQQSQQLDAQAQQPSGGQGQQ